MLLRVKGKIDESFEIVIKIWIEKKISFVLRSKVVYLYSNLLIDNVDLSIDNLFFSMEEVKHMIYYR